MTRVHAVLLPVIATAAVLSGCITTEHPRLGPAQIPEARADSLRIDAASRLVAFSPAIAGIWPGFWSSTQAFVLVAGGADPLLVTHASAPAWRTRVERGAYLDEVLAEAIGFDPPR